jgi:aminoglycoside N3'-acetyltransferase
MQLPIDFNTPQNTAENQMQYDEIKHRFGAQCQRLYEWLRSGKSITVKEAMNELNIGDARARIRDLREVMEIKDRLTQGRVKEYFI